MITSTANAQVKELARLMKKGLVRQEVGVSCDGRSTHDQKTDI